MFGIESETVTLIWIGLDFNCIVIVIVIGIGIETVFVIGVNPRILSERDNGQRDLFRVTQRG